MVLLCALGHHGPMETTQGIQEVAVTTTSATIRNDTLDRELSDILETQIESSISAKITGQHGISIEYIASVFPGETEEFHTTVRLLTLQTSQELRRLRRLPLLLALLIGLWPMLAVIIVPMLGIATLDFLFSDNIAAFNDLWHTTSRPAVPWLLTSFSLMFISSVLKMTSTYKHVLGRFRRA